MNQEKRQIHPNFDSSRRIFHYDEIHLDHLTIDMNLTRTNSGYIHSHSNRRNTKAAAGSYTALRPAHPILPVLY